QHARRPRDREPGAPTATRHSPPPIKAAAAWSARSHLLAVALQTVAAVALDTIGPAEVEKYKADKLRAKYSPKSINNQLTVLRKLLNLAVEYRELEHAPKIKQLKVSEHGFEFLDFQEVDRFLAAAVPCQNSIMRLDEASSVNDVKECTSC